MKKKKSLHLTAGLILGTAVAGAATFLYKTKKGKKLIIEFQKNFKDAKNHLPEIVKDIKKKAKQLEKSLQDSNQKTTKKTKKVKTQVKKAVNQVKKKVFKKSGKPLVK